MADLQDLQTIAQDAAFQGRCIVAFANAAAAVMAANESSGFTSAQQTFSTQVLNGQLSRFQGAVAVLTNATVAAEATVASLPGCTAVSDGDLQFSADSVFNALAGIPASSGAPTPVG